MAENAAKRSDLTPPFGKQQAVLAAVEQHNLTTRFPATNRDVCRLLGYSSSASAHRYLKALKRQGLVVQRGSQGYVVAGFTYEAA